MRGLRRAFQDGRVRVAVLMLAAAGLFALLGDLATPYGAAQIGVGPANQGPSMTHLLGTDPFGRDELARLVAGARISITIALVVAAVALSLGVPLGMVIGYAGGKADFLVGRLLDFMFAFPSMMLALTLAVVLGPGLSTAAIALAIIYVPIT